jgi:hypothetical protein
VSRLGIAIGIALLAAGCHRTAIVRSAPATNSGVVLRVENRAQQPVNVYAVSGGSDHFLGEVAAASSADLAIPTPLLGSRVELKARTVDGGLTFTRSGVILRGTVYWQLSRAP